MSFLALPNEILLIIAKFLTHLDGLYSLILTCRYFPPLITHLLLHELTSAIKIDGADSLLHWAAEKGYQNFVELLLSRGIGIDCMGRGTSTPLGKECTSLHNVARLGRDAVMVRFLAERGADVNHFDNYGVTALHYATSLELEDMVKVLLELGADPNIVDKSPDTSGAALHYAVLYQYLAILKLLLQKGANVNLRNGEGDMPLHLVFNMTYNKPKLFEVIELLLQGGADATAKNDRNMTFLDLAVEQGFKGTCMADMVKRYSVSATL